NRLLDHNLSSVARRVCFGTAESHRSRDLRLLHRVSRNPFPRGSVATRLVMTCSQSVARDTGRIADTQSKNGTTRKATNAASELREPSAAALLRLRLGSSAGLRFFVGGEENVTRLAS